MKRALATALLLSLAAQSQVWAQCSLCRLAVEQDASLGSAFNKGIVLMMIPALAVFAGVFLLLRKTAATQKCDKMTTKPETR